MSQCICTSTLTVAQRSDRSASDSTTFTQAKTVYGNRVEEPAFKFIQHTEYVKQQRIRTQVNSGKFGPQNS